MVEHVASLDWGCLALLCDSHMVDKSTKAYIHPKLSPYKTTFRIEKQENETAPDSEDLSRFVLYLNNMLRTNGIHTILTSTEQVVEMCLIPFVVSVDRTSLKNGIVHVENPSMALKEPVQVTDLVDYIATCCSWMAQVDLPDLPINASLFVRYWYHYHYIYLLKVTTI